MNCCCERKPAVHRQIEKRLKYDRRRQKREIKLLMFGKHGSGKSTVFRQLQIKHGFNYSEEMKSFITGHIYRNIYLAMQTLIDAMSTLEIHFDQSRNEQLAKGISCIDTYGMTTFSQEHANAIKHLWADKGIQLCYSRREDYTISNSTKYFLDAVERISQQDYLPSDQDITRVYIPTLGLQEYAFEQRGHLFRITEYQSVGILRERRILLQFFENTHVIIYIVDISEYDTLLQGSDNENEVNEAKEVFKNIVSHPWFSGASIVLFLNKMGIFREKILRCDLAEYFPAYSGPKQDVDSVSGFLKQMFLDVHQEKDRSIFPHFTCAVDTTAMTYVYDCVIQSVIQSHVKSLRVL